MTNQNQLSETAVRERLRAKTPDVLERLAQLVSSKNDSVALGACRLILDKVVPDIKSTIEVDASQIKHNFVYLPRRLSLGDPPQLEKPHSQGETAQK